MLSVRFVFIKNNESTISINFVSKNRKDLALNTKNKCYRSENERLLAAEDAVTLVSFNGCRNGC